MSEKDRESNVLKVIFTSTFLIIMIVNLMIFVNQWWTLLDNISLFIFNAINIAFVNNITSNVIKMLKWYFNQPSLSCLPKTLWHSWKTSHTYHSCRRRRSANQQTMHSTLSTLSDITPISTHFLALTSAEAKVIKWLYYLNDPPFKMAKIKILKPTFFKHLKCK